MSAFEEIEVSRKISLLSIRSQKAEAPHQSDKYEKEKEPNDVLYIVHILCFFMGVMNIMPVIFFSTAQNYWMYKFRNTSSPSTETTNGTDRNTLQSYFQSTQMAANVLPSVIFTIALTLYGHKLPAIGRCIAALSIQSILFIVFTVFTQIDTDSWQTKFFVITIGLSLINSACTSIVQMSFIVLLPKLPHKFTFIFLIGTNGTILSTSLQIFALSVTDRSLTTGSIYFTAGTCIILISLLLLFAGRKSQFLKYHDTKNSTQVSENISKHEAKELIKQIWPCLLIVVVTVLNLSCTMPSIITLIVSENDGDGTAWTGKFFTPVIGFLLNEIASILGRVSSKKFFLTHSNKWWYIVGVIIKCFVTVPFFFYCNAQPRNQPVIFNRDWEYITAYTVHCFLTGFFVNVAFMSIKTLATQKQEAALKAVNGVLSLSAAVFTANGLIMVKLLQL